MWTAKKRVLGPGVKGQEKEGGLRKEQAEKELSWRLEESLTRKRGVEK